MRNLIVSLGGPADQIAAMETEVIDFLTATGWSVGTQERLVVNNGDHKRYWNGIPIERNVTIQKRVKKYSLKTNDGLLFVEGRVQRVIGGGSNIFPNIAFMPEMLNFITDLTLYYIDDEWWVYRSRINDLSGEPIPCPTRWKTVVDSHNN